MDEGEGEKGGKRRLIDLLALPQVKMSKIEDQDHDIAMRALSVVERSNIKDHQW